VWLLRQFEEKSRWQWDIHRAGLNEHEAPGKVLTARPPKRLAQLLSVWHALFNFAEVPVKNVNTDTILQPTLQRQLGLIMYGGSYVVYLSKQKAVSQKTTYLPPWHGTQQTFLSYTLWPSLLHKSSICICLEERRLHSLADRKVNRLEKMFSTKYHAKAIWIALLDRPVISLGHQDGRRIFWETKFLKLLEYY